MNHVDLKNALINSFNNYITGVDTKNWQMVRSCFADEVSLDYGELSSSTVGTNVSCSSDAWIEVLQNTINGFDMTRHVITNHRIKECAGGVIFSAYLDADHLIFSDPQKNFTKPLDIVKLVGEYINEYNLVDGQWKIIKSQLRTDWLSGNLDLFEKAQVRAVKA